MIPDEAVEVAARRIADMLDMDASNWEWHADNARAVLEAAAPHMMAAIFSGERMARVEMELEPPHLDPKIRARMIAGILKGEL